jgi:predicted phage terminase large subunit-like protein
MQPSGEYKAGGSRTVGGQFYVEDVARFREGGKHVRAAIQRIASQDGAGTHVVIPQDPGQAGKDQAASIIAENAGQRITAERETGSKEVRAEPFAAQCEAGNVLLVRGPWNEAFLEELASFPNGATDDQVDAAAGAFTKLTEIRAPMNITMGMVSQIQRMGKHRRT